MMYEEKYKFMPQLWEQEEGGILSFIHLNLFLINRLYFLEQF